MKKVLKSTILMLLCAALFSGCVRIDLPDPEPQTAYASFYPVYALAAGVCENVPGLTLTCLTQPQDGCLRSYSLSDWDAARLADADMLVLGGRGLESFESSIVQSGMPYLTAMDNMPLLQNGDMQEDDHFTGDNPWYFLSVEGARSICSVIAGGMAQLDPDFADMYAQNLQKMLARFGDLQAKTDALLAGRQMPGAILMQEGLCYFAQDMGIAEYVEIRREAGADMSQNELEDALAQMAQSGFSLVLIERQAPQGIVEAIESEGYTVVLIDILTDHSQSEGTEGYFSAMLRNAQALAGALKQ